MSHRTRPGLDARQVGGLWLAALAILPFLITAATAAGAPQDLLKTPTPLTLTGDVATEVPQGVLHARSTNLDGFSLSLTAEAVTVYHAWRQGERVSGINGGDDLARHSHDNGSFVRDHTGVNLTADPFQASPEALALTAGPEQAKLQATGDGRTYVRSGADTLVTRVEEAPSTKWAGQSPDQVGFWYTIDGAWTATQQLDGGHAEGNFTLFLNNVTVEMTSDQGDWERWTGYREGPSRLPANAYESRVTILVVEQGSLSLEAKDTTALYGPTSKIDVDGEVTARNVQGPLALDDRLYRFEGTPLHLQGVGILDTQPQADRTSATEAVADDGPLPTRFTAAGAFSVDGAREVQALAQQSHETGQNWLLLSGLGVLTVAAVATAFSWSRITAAFDCHRAKRRQQNVRSWMQTGDRLVSVREYDRALGWYEKITDAYPNQAEAWYAQGVCLTELEDHGHAADAYERANELLGGDDPEILDLQGAAAWRAGQEDRAVEAFEALARQDPSRLGRRLSQDGFSTLKKHPRMAELLETDDSSSTSYV